MANFIKDSLAELEHVVWPTHIETKKFFTVVLSIIVGMTIFVYLLTLIFSNAMVETRKLIHAPKKADISGSPTVVPTVDNNALQINAETADGQSIVVTPSEEVVTPAN